MRLAAERRAAMEDARRTIPPVALRGFPWLLAMVLLILAACGGDSAPTEGQGSTAPAAAPTAEPTAGTADSLADDSAARPTVAFLGDSLTAGFGLAEEQAFPARVGERLAAADLPVRVVNAGVSGDTSAGGLARLDWVLSTEPAVVVVGLGANDGLRGLPLAATENNLRRILEGVRAAGARPLLLGMKLPPNYGADYAGGFEALYPRLARAMDVPLVPFLLAGVGGEPELNLPDGIHPNAEGHRRVAATITPTLRRLLEESSAAPRPGAGPSPEP